MKPTGVKLPKPSKPPTLPVHPQPLSKAPSVRVKRLSTPTPRPLGRAPTISNGAKNRMIEKRSDPIVKREAFKMGYNKVLPMQYDKVHGVDYGFFRTGKDGRVLRSATAESKASETTYRSPSVMKKQTSNLYRIDRLEKARAKGVVGADKLLRNVKRGKAENLGVAVNLKDKGARFYQRTNDGPLKQIQSSKPAIAKNKISIDPSSKSATKPFSIQSKTAKDNTAATMGNSRKSA